MIRAIHVCATALVVGCAPPASPPAPAAAAGAASTSSPTVRQSTTAQPTARETDGGESPASASTLSAATIPDAGAGRLPMEVLTRVVGTRIERIRDCYQTMLHWTPELEGRFTVTFVINTDGTINEPVVESSNFAEPLVVTCVIQQFRGLVFPPPVGGPMTVNAPFRFKLRKPEP